MKISLIVRVQSVRYLVDQIGTIVPREELLQQVWEYSGDISSRTLDMHFAWLRQKLEGNPQNPVHIQTIRTNFLNGPGGFGGVPGFGPGH